MSAPTTPRPTTVPPDPSWRLPTLIKASIVCHAGAGLAVAADPSSWPWALAAVAANHGVVTATGLLPRSTWLGENMRRLPDTAAARGEVSVTIDDGPDPKVTPAVLDQLDELGARATFFCIARHAAEHPALTREIVRRGHSVQNHSDVHRHNFSLLGLRGYTDEITRAQQRLGDITGVAPRFFRAPAGLRNPFLAPVLQRLGLTLVSWTRRGYDTVQRDPQRVLARLTHELAAGDIVLLHDGNAAAALHSGRPVILDVLPALLQRCAQAGLRTVTLPEAVAAR
ncbi:MAG TPA: polysaccharide deacetylase family protein [Burkholderiaceae bacterium]|nr:polysaccharide deacetylase family protein [Burkholderiaceae bacterium]